MLNMISISTILGAIASGKYDVAIMLPKRKKDALNILALCILIAFFFSGGIGIFFGIYPAFKASKLDPIMAIRNE